MAQQATRKEIPEVETFKQLKRQQELARLSQFAPQKGYFWAFVSWKPLILLGSISKTTCSADLPS